ncbi:MAG: glutamine--tRNA ligase/YqeY domain fusion protein [Bacteroidales bacterium]|nr:glutamine--tRNA ligase/YqeY domain fusion protein [Bacteroidales bacterium]
MTTNESKTEKSSLNFIEQIIEKDLKEGKNNKAIHVRFPPEPNGYLHIGHAKSICLNFGLAEAYDGTCNLRFDDTNPSKENIEYVESIKKDIEWLGFKWHEQPKFTSDYFEQLYQYAISMIKAGHAYVCEQSAEEIAEYKGTPTTAGKESTWRNRPIDESLEWFEKMKNGEVEEGKMSLRAKIDMSSPNMHLRDPLMYRIKRASHHRTGNDWNIYPMYDFAHGQSDYIEGITHSICTLEFEVHRPLYDWFLDQIIEEGHIRPRQIEFARLNLSYTVMSKRKLLQLVEEGHVSGWDDPRMPTISGIRRRGYTPKSMRTFAEMIGVAKRDNMIDLGKLEFAVREDLNKIALRRMAVMDPLKVVITNYPENKIEHLPAVNNPEDETAGERMIPFSREIYIEREDFMEDAPKKFFRLSVGREVRLRYAYFITCNEVIKNEQGEIVELRATYDPESKGGKSPDGRKVKGTLHWVSAQENKQAQINIYDRLFNVEDPQKIENGQNFLDNLNPDSLKTITAFVEPSLGESRIGEHFQFERIGYFCPDYDSKPNQLIFNKTVGLKDSWAKLADKD